MNRTIKVGIAALALASVVPAFAQEEVEETEGAVGWSAVALGVATPVQLPWGFRWNVYGLDVNFLYSDAPNVYGLDVGGLATVTREDFMGLGIGGLANLSLGDVYGLRASLGFNMCRQNVYGMEAGLAGLREHFWGLDVHLLGSAQYTSCGCMIAGLANVARDESYGATIALGANFAKVAYGCQCAIVFNYTEELHGCQISLVNYAATCPSGFQIGLINIIMDNEVKVLPILNGYF